MAPRIQDALQRLERFLPSQKLWLLSPETQRVEMGGWRCVSADTRIGGIPIAEFSEKTISTLYGHAPLVSPSLKGRQDLYRVRTLSGRQVSVTLDHRFLTPQGWRQLKDLSVGSVISADGSESGCSVLGIEPNFRGYNFLDSRRGDELPTPEEVVSQDILRQLRSSNVGNSAKYRTPFHAYKTKNASRFDSFSFVEFPFSLIDGEQPRSPFFDCGRKEAPQQFEYNLSQRDTFGQSFYPTRLFSANREASKHRAYAISSVSAEDLSEALKQFFSDCRALHTPQSLVARFWEEAVDPNKVDTGDARTVSSYAYWDSITEITYHSNSQYYALHVPFANHFSAEGLWHANSGKTRALCTASVFLSYLIPDNYGFIGRASGKDLHSTTIQTFFDEVCPPEMVVGKPRKMGQSGLEVILRTRYEGYTSKIYFDYIIDRSTNRSHLAGGNWGWFGVDQMEEIGRGDWHKLMGRLSRMYFHPELKKRMPIKTHALGVGNQMGHDWIFEDFFQGGDYIFDVIKEPTTFFKSVRKSNKLGIIVRSEENAASNGGFVPDEYFANLRATMPPEWIARYMDGSFDDFSGKIYSEYNLTSVHNIEPFKIPSHWPWHCYIDPGGSVPWGVGIVRIDEQGNSIIVDDAESLYKGNVNPVHALNWVRKYLPVDKSRVVMDY